MTLILLADAAVVGVLTTVHLLMIAGFAVLVIAGMVWGARQKHRRNAAEDAADAHQAETAPAPPLATVPPPAEAPTPATSAQEQVVAPPPPPLAEPMPAAGTGVPLTRLKGLGPKAASLLAERGVGDVAALAALPEVAAAELDADLGAFSGRLSRDRWVEQARLLTAGDVAGYEQEFGKLG